MKVMLTKKRKLFFSIIVFSCLLAVAGNLAFADNAYNGPQTPKRILVLNSYDADFSWVQNMRAGIEAVLGDNKNISLYTDYLDAKRNLSPEYIQRVYDFYRYKYSTKSFDAIIVTDDVAYNFMLKYANELFPNTPVVFCGVNNFDEARFAGHDMFTGVIETIDIRKTLEVALKLHPFTKQIVIMNDKTPVGAANKKLLQEVIPDFEKQVDFSFLEDMDMAEIQDKVASLPSNSLIIMMIFNQDQANHTFTDNESFDLISQKARVPIYSVWDAYLGRGLVGGMLTSGFSQGSTAANMVKQILEGEKPANIPVARESPNQYMFDYNQLRKFKINESKLPAGSIIINKPASFYTEYKPLVWGVGVCIGILILIICALYYNIIQRKKVEDELKIYATTDNMTGTLNRRTGRQFLEKKLALARNAEHKLTICFIDVNNLKTVNDTYGHHEGDNLIKVVSKLIKDSLRETDTICRFGGDEFLIIFPACDLNQAKAVGTRISQHIKNYNSLKLHPFAISISKGFAEYDPLQPVPPEVLIKAADYEMYRDKRVGKGQC